MFSFIPQLLIILSLAGIIYIVLRRTPEVTRFPMPVLLKNIFRTTREFLGFLLQKLWHFVLEVKEISKKTHPLAHLPKSFPRFSFPKPKLPVFFKSTDSPEFFISQGEAALDREDFPEAERNFIKAIKKDPASEQAFASLGRLYISQHKDDEAVQTFKFLARNHPDNPSYHGSLGQAYHNSKLYDKAIACFETAIELEPTNPGRYINLGLTLEAKRHLEEAILNYRKAVDLESENSQFVLILCEALRQKGDKEEAEVLLEK